MDKKKETVVLYSDAALRLLKGREGDRSINQYPIYGLMQFAKRNSLIWDDAKNKNPYAVWFLIRLDKKQDAVQATLDRYSCLFKDSYNDGSGVDYQEILFNEESFPLDFKTPYSWNAMRHIKQFDSLFLKAAKLNNIGLMKKPEFNAFIREVNKVVAASFNEASFYVTLELSIEDIKNKTENSKKAAKKMGIVPSKILNKEIVPYY